MQSSQAVIVAGFSTVLLLLPPSGAWGVVASTREVVDVDADLEERTRPLCFLWW
jgi:hypothetical protein